MEKALNPNQKLKLKPKSKPKKKSQLQKRIEDPNSRLWRNKADKAWKELVHKNFNKKCAICGASENVQAHHLIPREMGSHRHVVTNGVLLCSSHHKYSFILSPHKAPIEFAKWMIANKPGLWEWVLEQVPCKESPITYKDRVNILSENNI